MEIDLWKKNMFLVDFCRKTISRSYNIVIASWHVRNSLFGRLDVSRRCVMRDYSTDFVSKSIDYNSNGKMRFVTLRQIVYFQLSSYNATRVTTGFSLWFIVLNRVTDSAVGIVLFARTVLRSTSPSVLRGVSYERAAHVPRVPKEQPPVGYRVHGISLYRFVTAVTDRKHVTAPCGRTQRNRVTWRVFVRRVSDPVSGLVSTRVLGKGRTTFDAFRLGAKKCLCF